MLIQSVAPDASFSDDLVCSSHLAPGRVRLGLGRSQEVRASPELQNGGLRALGEAWSTSSRLRHFFVKPGRFLWPLVISKCLSWKLRGTGKPRAPERWTESSGKGLDNQLQVEALALL